MPVFNSVNKPYDHYIKEIDFWCVASKIDKKQQGVLLAYELPANDPSGIRDQVFNELDLVKLNADGVTVFKDYMDKMFKKDDQTVQFDSFRHRAKQK